VVEGAAPIVNGETSIGDDAVVALMTQGQHFCSGTLVRDRYVVTAAHCLPPNIPTDATEIDVFFGLDVSGPGTTIGVVDALAHPNWDIDNLGYDVGVIELAQAAPAAPIPMFTDAVTASHRGAEIRMVGYGITSAGGDDNGLKRHGTGELDDFDAFSLQIASDPSGTCSGDSGGTALIDVDGTEYLIGIHSRSDCVAFALDERVDTHHDDFIMPFIDGVVTNCAADGTCNEDCEDDPDCGPACVDDGVCEAGCADDPDCGPVCEADGACDEACTDDPDCAPVCEADETCVVECAEGEDPDCEPAAEDSGGGCAITAGSPDDASTGGPLLLAVLGVALAFGRSRSRRR